MSSACRPAGAQRRRTSSGRGRRGGYLLGLLLLHSTVWAEAPDAAAQRAALAAVETYLSAMRAGDAAAAAAVLHPDYRVTSWQAAGGERHLFLDTRAGELAAIGKLKPGEWEVRLLRTRVAVDPNGMANVWTKYEFYSFGKLEHCGFESYELFRTPQGWRIINFSDTDTPVPRPGASRTCGG